MRLICGGLSGAREFAFAFCSKWFILGAIACITCYPLDLIKTRLTVDKHGHYKGITHAICSVLKSEGIGGLYRGNSYSSALTTCNRTYLSGLSTALAVCVPTLAISYSSYGTLKSLIIARRESVLYSRESGQLTVFGGLLCGSASGEIVLLDCISCDWTQVLRRPC